MKNTTTRISLILNDARRAGKMRLSFSCSLAGANIWRMDKEGILKKFTQD